MRNLLVLLCDGARVADRVIGDEAIEVGRASSADLRVDDDAVAERACLVQAKGGTVWIHAIGDARSSPRVLPLDRPERLSPRFSLLRTLERRVSERVDARTTAPLPSELPRVESYRLLVGRGADARRVSIGERPLWVGKAPHNDLVLRDPTVSGEHCRFELAAGRLLVRDLGSLNGTHVQGVRVARAELGAGAVVRVGRTDLYVVARCGEPAGASSAMVAESAEMQKVLVEARRFAALSWPLLVLGPSGVGKEELASLVHREGARRRGPFVALNAGGLPRELVESELFGHERGAFTGAHAQRRGVFEQAEGGTLFLDEIGELPLSLQTRLLRVLESWRIRRVGGEQDVSVDLRLVCATHRDLARMVQEGAFRQDLYYRLARLVLRVRPLSERPDDVIPLARHFLRSLTAELGERTLSAAAEARLLAHDWPGNARELRNVLCAAAALSAAPELDADDLERALGRIAGPLARGQLEPDAIERAVARYGGNLSAASRALAVPRSTLRDRLKRGAKDE